MALSNKMMNIGMLMVSGWVLFTVGEDIEIKNMARKANKKTQEPMKKMGPQEK